MKRFLILLIVSSIAAFNMQADECSDYLNDANTAFSQGQWEKAKHYYKLTQQHNCGYNVADKIRQCDEKLNPTPKQANAPSSKPTAQTTLSASKTSVTFSGNGGREFVSIYSNKSWRIDSNPEQWCHVSTTNSGITLVVDANVFSFVRNTSMRIETTDGQKNLTINITLQAKPSSGSSSQSSDEIFSYNPTSFSFDGRGGNKTLYVNTNGKTSNWTYESPSWITMTWNQYGGSFQVSCKANNSTTSRSGYIKLIAKDKGKTTYISVTQQGNYSYSSSSNTSSSSSSSSYYSSNSNNSSRSNSRSYNNVSALTLYDSYHGTFEMEWLSFRGCIGTGAEAEIGLFGMRLACVKLEPLVVGYKYNFLGDMKGAIYYQPELKFVIPWNGRFAVEFGAGPKLIVRLGDDFYPRETWFAAEAGIRHAWGNAGGSSNYFIRYDGMFVVGVSLNLSNGYDL